MDYCSGMYNVKIANFCSNSCLLMGINGSHGGLLKNNQTVLS